MAPQPNSSASANAVNDDPLPSSPYYLHPSDNSSLILVPEPLTSDNFHSWFRSMDMALTIKNKLGFVDGSIREPEVNPRGQILLMDPMPPINKVFSLIRQEERQRSIGSLNASLSNPFVESTTLLCKSEGTKTVGSRQFFQKKERPQCTHCGLLGHTVDKCYKLHGFPLGYKTQGKNPTANKISLTSFGQTAGVVTNEFSNLQLSQVQAQCEQVLALLNNKTLSNPIGHASNSHHQASANTISSNLPSSSMTGLHPLEDDWTG
uniref:Retrotransposon Copia-like N-terminal domain-containing protein n=1 Tax=Fagus sylvatica TaxID=28930 RepID=A0A2N9IWD4_FAGSY